ncbi:hypothetical protein ACI2OX_08085 [Bacillus sp. N9]
MEKILHLLNTMQEEQRQFGKDLQIELSNFRKEIRVELSDFHKEIRVELSDFRKEINDRFEKADKRLEAIEKYAIQNGEKLDNNRDYTSRKITFIEHKNIELEQRIFELENQYGRQ